MCLLSGLEESHKFRYSARLGIHLETGCPGANQERWQSG
jgi:hypothetical protein